MLGGGQSYFNREDKNWLDVLPEHGMQVVTDMQKLNLVDTTPVMGLLQKRFAARD